MNICVNCKYLFCNEQSNPEWYDYFCHHPSLKRPRVTNPVTGKLGYGLSRQGEDPVYRGFLNQFPNANEINTDGRCNLYEGR